MLHYSNILSCILFCVSQDEKYLVLYRFGITKDGCGKHLQLISTAGDY